MTPPALAIQWDPAPLTRSQQSGDACVGCAKVWPRPTHRVGVLGPAEDQGAQTLFGDSTPGTPLLACDDCAPGIVAQVEAEAAHRSAAEDSPAEAG